MTQGAGVDVVLNALTGSFLQHSIDLLAPFGRFVEIGKSDIMANARMDMGNFSSSKSFAAFDLVELVREKPAMAADILSQVHRLFQTGVIKQPFPLTVSDISHVADTFRLMQKGEHVGKLVVSHTGDSEVKVCLALGEVRLQQIILTILVGNSSQTSGFQLLSRCHIPHCRWPRWTGTYSLPLDGPVRSKVHCDLITLRLQEASYPSLDPGSSRPWGPDPCSPV